MLEHYLTNELTKTRLRSGPMGPFIDDFAGHLKLLDYRFSTGRNQLRFVACLAIWLGETGRPISLLDEETLETFRAELPTRPWLRPNKGSFEGMSSATTLLLSWLRLTGVVQTTAPPRAPVPSPIAGFEAWMLQHRQVAPTTVEGCYRVFLRRFLSTLGERPETYTALGIRSFILDQAAHLSRKSIQTSTSAIRMFLRYLATQGKCSPDLISAVPTVARWRKDVLPQWLGRQDVERIVSATDATRPNGCRDRAVLLLLARLGLRAGDIRGLRLVDIDWPASRLWVCGKGRRRQALPLPQDVGDALLDYLTRVRPEVDHDHAFVRLQAPHNPFGGSTVSTLVVRAAARAGVALPRGGAHVLRHSLATALLADGMSLDGIGAVLRHKDLDTTLIYAKVDTSLLRMVARPWPLEVRS